MGIKCERKKGEAGGWIDPEKENERKICDIGIKCSGYVTMHGLALNVNTDLSFFDYINPCGFSSKSVTSMEKELDKKISIEDVKKLIIYYSKHIF